MRQLASLVSAVFLAASAAGAQSQAGSARPKEAVRDSIAAAEKVPARFVATGFYERRQKSRDGLYLDPGEVEKRAGTQLTRLLESAPGFRIVNDGRTRRLQNKSAQCEAALFVDGRFVMTGHDARQGGAMAAMDDVVAGTDVYAVEAHRRTPAEFQVPGYARSNDCGAVLVWTRRFVIE